MMSGESPSTNDIWGLKFRNGDFGATGVLKRLFVSPSNKLVLKANFIAEKKSLWGLGNYIARKLALTLLLQSQKVNFFIAESRLSVTIHY
jgi:hypothetical protein